MKKADMEEIQAVRAVQAVKAQYESLPYPPRDPGDEKTRLIRTWLEDLPKINYYCFGGKNSFRDGLRVLIAGGGTGDATIFLAWQLRSTNARIVHLDLSATSIDIARRRAAERGLTNIEWVNASLLEYRGERASFDYINCAGVLHHLPDPDAGFRALDELLASNGAMGLMVYGKYGRAGVYQMQELMRLVNADCENQAEALANAKQMLASLPPSNWFVRGGDLYNDHRNGDAGIYDLLLHSTDRAYTVNELYAWLQDGHGFNLEFTDVYAGRSAYLPHVIMGNLPADQANRFRSLPARRQHAIAEIMSGRITTHSFYLTRGDSKKAPYRDVNAVPMYFHEPVNGLMMEQIFNTNKNKSKTFVLQHQRAGVAFPVRRGKYGPRILHEIDGGKTFGEIFDRVRDDIVFKFDHPTNDLLFDDFEESFNALNCLDRLILRRKNVLPLDG